jgi:hypothetical protein
VKERKALPSPTKELPAVAAPPLERLRLFQPTTRTTPEGLACKLSTTVLPKGAESEAEEWTFAGEVDEEPAEMMARLRTNPAQNAGEVVLTFNGSNDDSLPGMVNALHAQSEAVKGGDMSQLEGMLAAQAHSLDAIFCRLSKLGRANMVENLGAFDTYMRLALRAQSQCRTTVEALGQLKNPSPVAFVKQANVAVGNQQINNGLQPPARENQSPPNKLMEDFHGERMDAGTTGAPSKANQNLEPLGKVHRAADVDGKGKGGAKRIPGRGKT